MHRSFILSVSIFLLFAIFVFPVGAQDGEFTDEELELIDFVALAQENLLTLPSFQARTDQTIRQEIAVEQGTQTLEFVQEITQNVETLVQTDGEGNVDGIYAYLDQNTLITDASGITLQELGLTLEMVKDQENYYARFSNLPLSAAGSLPEGWFNMADFAGAGFDFSAIETMTGRESLSIYPLNDETILAIEELDTDTLGGQKMRVFQVELNPRALVEEAGLLQLVDLSQLGEEGEDFLTSIVENMDMVQMIWIGAESEMPYQIVFHSTMSEVELPIAPGENMTMTQTTEAEVNFSDFGEPVEIEVPVIGN